MSNITYADKDKTVIDGVKNKWRDVDANEVKSAVNSKADATSLTAKEDVTNKSSDGTFATADNNKYPTTQAVKTFAEAKRDEAKTYAESLVVGLWDDRGNFNASGGAYPSTGGSGVGGAIRKGDIWTISVGGTLPTAQVVEPGDTVRALIDTPGNTQANWSIQQNNIGYTPAPNNSPTFTGTPTAPTAPPGTNTTQLATTAFARAADDLKLNKGANSEFESLVDSSDDYGVAFLSRLGSVFKSASVRWNESLKQLRVIGTQAIWSAVDGVTDGNMGIKTLEGVIESFKLFDNSGNFLTTGVDSGKRLIRHFTAVRLFSGIYFTETELNSIAAVGSATTLIKSISTTANTIIVVSVDNICVQNIDKNYIIGRAQFSFKNDGGTLTQISQNFLRYDHQYSTIKGSPGIVTNTDTRVDASISGTTININIVVTENKLTNIICETKYCITQLPS